jgi:anti-sigma factor RsiW
MQCERVRELMSAYVDGELEGEARRSAAAHVEECPSCSALASDYRRIGGLIAEAGREPASPALALSLRRNLALAAGTGAAPVRPGRVRSLPDWLPFRAGAFSQAATLAAVSVLSALVTWWIVASADEARLIQHDVLAAHVRSLLSESPVQIAQSDTHTVKPWFAGRVDFAPEVKDLTSEGFPLLGGRLDYVAGRRVGVLVYKRRLHTISVFMWPAAATGDHTLPRLTTPDGYNVLSWSDRGLTIWAISDLNAGELRELQGLL